MVQFNWVIPLLNRLSEWVNHKLNPGFASFTKFKAVSNSFPLLNGRLTTPSKDLEKKINRVVERHNKGIDDGTVFDEILNSSLSDYESASLKNPRTSWLPAQRPQPGHCPF